MNTDLNHTISTASFNLHGKAFTDPFNISVKNCKDTVTGCIGFGLQRWLTAFISQYNWDDNNWPEIIKQEYIKVND
jgi:seryl-tRNA synthetase